MTAAHLEDPPGIRKLRTVLARAAFAGLLCTRHLLKDLWAKLRLDKTVLQAVKGLGMM